MSLFFNGAFSLGAPAVPDFTVKTGMEENQGAWLVELTPPAHHHFNVDAPMKVTSHNGQVFGVVVKEKMRLGFRSPDSELKAGEVITASAFLCDDAKTFCVKKQLEFPLKEDSGLKKIEASNPKAKHRVGGGEVVSSLHRRSHDAKDKEGFWDNHPQEAIDEARAQGKPLLIDFYGIWCPPCNLYNEQVFSKKAFREIASRYVLLKMDADRETSFDLKSRFKIGGYPTILISSPDLKEINRVVGYYPLSEFVTILKQNAEAHGGLDLKTEVKRAIERKETADAIKKVKSGLIADPENAYFKIVKLSLESNEHPEILNRDETVRWLHDLIVNAKQQDTDTLLELQNLVVSHIEIFSKTDLAKKLGEVYDALSRRVNADTLSVPGAELSIADLDGLKMEWAQALKDEHLMKDVRAHAIQSYQTLMKKFNAKDSRGYNLELAYYLWNDGQVKAARNIYDRMIKTYPTEFTFYFAASKMFLDTHDLKNSKKYAENAVKYAYGDNLIRSTERLIRVLIAQGEKKQARALGVEFLKAHPTLSGMNVRTNRYLEQIEKAIKDTQ